MENSQLQGYVSHRRAEERQLLQLGMRGLWCTRSAFVCTICVVVGLQCSKLMFIGCAKDT